MNLLAETLGYNTLPDSHLKDFLGISRDSKTKMFSIDSSRAKLTEEERMMLLNQDTKPPSSTN